MSLTSPGRVRTLNESPSWYAQPRSGPWLRTPASQSQRRTDICRRAARSKCTCVHHIVPDTACEGFHPISARLCSRWNEEPRQRSHQHYMIEPDTITCHNFAQRC